MTLIEFFDKDTIKNILSVLTIKPDRIVYIYDSAVTDDKYFAALKKCFKKHLPGIKMEKIPVDINNVRDIYGKAYDVIKK